MPVREQGAAGITVEGQIAQPLPNALFRVALPDGREVLAHVGGRLRLGLVRLLPGDRVRVELAPHDSGRGRIVERLGTKRPGGDARRG